MSVFLPIILSFAFACIFAPLYIRLARRLNFGQNILSYVKEHEGKQGTPTMGGVIFILPTLIFSLIFTRLSSVTIFIMAVFLSYALVGFLDDFIKVKYKRNLGLRAYQKIIFQLAIAISVAVYVHGNSAFSTVYIPFTSASVNMGIFIIPFIVLVFLATSNSVNLTDGLDGLAGGTSLCFLIIFAAINTFYIRTSAVGDSYISALGSINSIAFCAIGSLLGFLMFNHYPAKIFMGDTGSLSLGALVAMLCTLSGTILYLPIIGIMFVISSLSVIIQVLHFKRTHRRVFLMAPFHHHLQHKGIHETKITFIYIVITLLMGLTSLALLGVL